MNTIKKILISGVWPVGAAELLMWAVTHGWAHSLFVQFQLALLGIIATISLFVCAVISLEEL